MTLSQMCEREIVELHQFFADWFNGDLDDNDAEFARFDEVIAPEFVIVGPEGEATERQSLQQALRQAHGGWRDRQRGRIWIENCRLQWETADSALLTYEEWQTISDETTARVSTVLFTVEPAAANGVVWQHVHETWKSIAE